MMSLLTRCTGSPLLRPALCSALIAASPAFGQLAPRLQLLEPAANSRNASPAASIRMRSTEPLDAQTIASSVYVAGRWSGPVAGVVSLLDPQTIVFAPARAFFPGESVSVRVSSALRSRAGLSLRGGFATGFWIASAPGSGSFALAQTIYLRDPGEVLLQTYGVFAADLDGDGAADLSAVNEQTDDVRVLRNDGCGGYARTATNRLPSGSQPSTNEGADFNGDGRIDLAVGDLLGNAISVLMGNGSGGYAPAQTYPTGVMPRGLCVLDLEGDGDLDIATANRSSSNVGLHRNRGDGTFDPVQLIDGGGFGETAIAAGDANGDGWADLWVANFASDTVTTLLNDGQGNFTALSWANVGARPWSIALGDLDDDGDLDAVTCDSAADRASILRGGGGGHIGSVTSVPVGAFPLAVDLGDLEGDGDLDLVVSTYSGASYALWRNAGDGSFAARQDLPASSAGSCAVLVDDDRDGDLDVIGIDEIDDALLVYRQTEPSAPGTQARSCDAALRIDGSALRAGVAGRPPLFLRANRAHFAGLSGPPRAPCVLFTGHPLSLALGTPFGAWSLDPALTMLVGTGALGATGEIALRFDLPPVPARTAPFALQALVIAPTGAVLSNAEQVVVGG
ncbi:MAG: VCBS repeat-containing protein [Planctomycetes bacterium]|nr:VCBS repeat-containing protein [Planctomycetota bacterium]